MKRVLDVILIAIYLMATIFIGLMYFKGLKYGKVFTGLLFFIQILSLMGHLYITDERSKKKRIISLSPLLIAVAFVIVYLVAM